MPAPLYEVKAPIDIPEIVCARVTQVPGGLCITFPGGVELCASMGVSDGDLVKMTQGLFAQINSALMPLQPFFNVLDVLVAIFNCITAIPKAIAIPPDLTALPRCLEELAKALAVLLAMLPALSVPRLVKGILLALAMALTGVKAEIQAIIAQEQRIIEAATLAAEPGNVHLQAVVDCANANASVQLQNLNASLAPLNRMLGLINMLLKVVPGAPTVPTIADLGNDAQSALNVIDPAIEAMLFVANALPVPA